MNLESYLNTVTEQIRFQKARSLVSDELRAHILDQAEAYEAEGMFEEEAMEKAVRDMGDPVETGVALDRIHRPQMSAELLILIGLISAASIAVHGILGAYSQEIDGAGYGYLWEHIRYTGLGYVLMLLVYRLDYSFFAKYTKHMTGALLLLIVLGTNTALGVTINGAMLYIHLGPFFLFLPTVMNLFVPLFGGLLYQYRGSGYGGIAKLLIWALVPVWIASGIPSLTQAMVLLVSFAVLFAVAVRKGWYRVNKRIVLAGLAVLVPAVPLLRLGGRLAAYQVARLQAFLSGAPEYDYFAMKSREVLSGSRLVGMAPENLMKVVELPGFNNDYVLVSLIAGYGILAGVLAAALLAFLLMKIFRISFRQKNQLGMILGCGCGLVYLMQILMSFGVNLGILPTTATLLPFFSAGGSGTVMCYILMGLVLSIYRYKNILPESAVEKKMHRIFRAARLKA